jgi:hypothetical protein
LRTGFLSAIVAVVVWDLVKIIESIVIPKNMIPAELITKLTSPVDFISAISGSLLLVMILGTALAILFNQIPGTNAVAKSLVLSLIYLLLISGLTLFYDSTLGFFLLVLLTNTPAFILFGITQGVVFEKLRSQRSERW